MHKLKKTQEKGLAEKSKAVSVADRRGLQGCGTSRLARCLDTRLTDGGKVVSPTHRPRCTPHKHFSPSGNHFFQRLSKLQDLVRPQGLGARKFVHLTGFRTRDLPDCSIAPWRVWNTVHSPGLKKATILIRFVTLSRHTMECRDGWKAQNN
jgi:hypothetical protein